MIYLKSQEQFEIIRENGLILGACHAEVAKIIRPGVSTLELDKVAFEFIKDHKAHPSFLNYQVGSRKYPFSLCISVNDVVVHGLPGGYQLKEGDIISIDGGVFKNGFHADSAYTYALNGASEEVQQLLIRTKESLYLGIEKAVDGNGWEILAMLCKVIPKDLVTELCESLSDMAWVKTCMKVRKYRIMEEKEMALN